MKKEWEQYPVIRLDISMAKAQVDADALRHSLVLLLSPYEKLYGKNPMELTPGQILTGIIQRAYEITGKQAVVIVDEYDAPLLDVLHDDESLSDKRQVMQEFYVPLKANERYVKFCFVTGITKFSQLSIFSTINNLTNVTMDAKFGAICGITEQEMLSEMSEDIDLLADKYEISHEEMCRKLKM